MFSRNGKTYKLVAAFLVAVFAFFMTGLNNLISVDAGSSQVYVVSHVSVSGDNINGGDFKIEGGVYAKDGKVVFDGKIIRLDNGAVNIKGQRVSHIAKMGDMPLDFFRGG